MAKDKADERAEDDRLKRAWVDAMHNLTVAENHTIGMRRKLAEGVGYTMTPADEARIRAALPLCEATESTARDQVSRIEEQQRARRESKNIRVLEKGVRVTLLAAITSLVAASPQLVDGVLKALRWVGWLK